MGDDFRRGAAGEQAAASILLEFDPALAASVADRDAHRRAVAAHDRLAAFEGEGETIAAGFDPGGVAIIAAPVKADNVAVDEDDLHGLAVRIDPSPGSVESVGGARRRRAE